jgi:ribosomal protein S18 acetylase RimI-like enzyme
MNSIYIKEDNWLSKIIGKRAFSVLATESFIELVNFENSIENQWLNSIQNNASFAFCKVDPLETKLIEGLQSIGFNLVDTNVSLENLSPQVELNSNFEFCFAQTKDKAETMGVAANSFVYSRFHLDHRISNDIADKVKELWVGNFFTGQRGTHMVIAKEGQKIIGFLQIVAKVNHYIIDLVAVSNDYRKKGVAKGLIGFANTNLTDIKSVLVGTQIANIPSINLYEKLGFSFKSAKYVFHYNKD